MLGLGLGLVGPTTLSARNETALSRILGAGGLDFAVWDSAFRDGLFSEPTGPTAISANGDAPGLWIDAGRRKRRVLAAALTSAPQLIANPAFANGLTNWSTPNGSAALLADGWARVSSTDGSTSGRMRQIFPTEVGALYAVTVQSRQGVGGRPIIRVQTSDNPATAVLSRTAAADGIETIFFVSTSADLMRVLLYVPTSTVGAYADFRFCEVRKVPGHYAIQPTAGYKPVLQASGAKFDGLDDNLLTDWYAQVGANCLLAQVEVPAAPGGDQFIAGTSDASAGRFLIGIQASSGKAIVAVGSAARTAAASPDLRGQSAMIGFGFDGTTANVFVNDALVDSFDQSGNLPTTSVPSRIGALNSAGTAAGYFGGTIRRLAFGRLSPTIAQYRAIRSEWLTT
jgi:hypothetical protein